MAGGGMVWEATPCPGQVDRLAAAFTDLTVPSQEPVHRRLRAQVNTPVQEDGVDLDGRYLGEVRGMEHVEDPYLLLRGERAGMRAPFLPRLAGAGLRRWWR